uniref:USP domain-containing protein n=1 Tax=Chromera velia CCMP2878 TaxID=1169474 RepID=A0A0G4HHE6_9ALVE|eukprot:Cvel_27643.t1-p1 / transcript=Cvel_27643.t1 / gene=Cvel_27643 / organism=Chromera_velia_CCMP2878 / gene_product=Ubiquitin carboxyl-terminal hydrolase DUB-1, putative / transcript_product=Ubiquitin carboxyl-terminal hydrolase DUB-1, putative / location=Cvel_scaffold3480:163-11839(+) / protein_length=1769 / sequence_SO=supercontig / SO=protein_coding / is_pseudo=false
MYSSGAPAGSEVPQAPHATSISAILEPGKTALQQLHGTGMGMNPPPLSPNMTPPMQNLPPNPSVPPLFQPVPPMLNTGSFMPPPTNGTTSEIPMSVSLHHTGSPHVHQHHLQPGGGPNIGTPSMGLGGYPFQQNPAFRHQVQPSMHPPQFHSPPPNVAISRPDPYPPTGPRRHSGGLPLPPLPPTAPQHTLATPSSHVPEESPSGPPQGGVGDVLNLTTEGNTGRSGAGGASTTHHRRASYETQGTMDVTPGAGGGGDGADTPTQQQMQRAAELISQQTQALELHHAQVEEVQKRLERAQAQLDAEKAERWKLEAQLKSVQARAQSQVQQRKLQEATAALSLPSSPPKQKPTHPNPADPHALSAPPTSAVTPAGASPSAPPASQPAPSPAVPLDDAQRDSRRQSTTWIDPQSLTQPATGVLTGLQQKEKEREKERESWGAVVRRNVEESAATRAQVPAGPMRSTLLSLRMGELEKIAEIQRIFETSLERDCAEHLETAMQHMQHHPSGLSQRFCLAALRSCMATHPDSLLSFMTAETVKRLFLSSSAAAAAAAAAAGQKGLLLSGGGVSHPLGGVVEPFDECQSAEFLHSFLVFKAKMVAAVGSEHPEAVGGGVGQGSPPQPPVGRDEAWRLLCVCINRSEIQKEEEEENDGGDGETTIAPQDLPPSDLRDWLLKIWWDVPPSQCESPPVWVLVFHWMAQIDSPPEAKVPLLLFIKSEVERLGSRKGCECVVSHLLETLCSRNGACSRDLQHVLGLVDPTALPEAMTRLLSQARLPAGRLLTLFIALVIYTWQAEPPPSCFMGILLPPLHDEPDRLYFLVACLCRATLKVHAAAAAERERLAAEAAAVSGRRGTREQVSAGSHSRDPVDFVLEANALVEAFVRAIAAKAANPLNAPDAVQLLAHVVVTGPLPLLSVQNGISACASSIPFLERLYVRWSVPSSRVPPEHVDILGKLLGILRSKKAEADERSKEKRERAKERERRAELEREREAEIEAARLKEAAMKLAVAGPAPSETTDWFAESTDREGVDGSPDAETWYLSDAETHDGDRRQVGPLPLATLNPPTGPSRDAKGILAVSADSASNLIAKEPAAERVPAESPPATLQEIQVATPFGVASCFRTAGGLVSGGKGGKRVHAFRSSGGGGLKIPVRIQPEPRSHSKLDPDIRRQYFRSDAAHGHTSERDDFDRRGGGKAFRAGSRRRSLPRYGRNALLVPPPPNRDLLSSPGPSSVAGPHDPGICSEGPGRYPGDVPFDVRSEPYMSRPVSAHRLHPFRHQHRAGNGRVPADPYHSHHPSHFLSGPPENLVLPPPPSDAPYIMPSGAEVLSLGHGPVPYVPASSTLPFPFPTDPSPPPFIMSDMSKPPQPFNTGGAPVTGGAAGAGEGPALAPPTQEPPRPASPMFLAIPAALSAPSDALSLKFPKAPMTGLRNLGNTCYLNSFLQAMHMTEGMVANLFHFKLEKNVKSQKSSFLQEALNQPLLKSLQRLMSEFLITKRKALDATPVIQSLPDMYGVGQQQDVTEAGRYIFEALGGYEQALIRTVFAGVLSHKIECQKCKRISERRETIQDLQFPVPTEAQWALTKKKKKSAKLSVQTLFSDMVQKEELSGDNAYHCEKCNRKRTALKWVEILSPPAHLFLILNRFSWNLFSGERKKEKTHVDICPEIEVCGFHYQLYCAIIHSGATANSGHYYSIGCRSESNKNRWYQFDDSQVTEVDAGRINELSKESDRDHRPYVVFYRCTQAPARVPLRVPVSIHKAAQKAERHAIENEP